MATQVTDLLVNIYKTQMLVCIGNVSQTSTAYTHTVKRQEFNNVVPSLDWIGWAEAVGQKEGQQLANSHLLQPASELTPVFNQKLRQKGAHDI